MGILYIDEELEHSTYFPTTDLYKTLLQLFPNGLTGEEISRSVASGRLRGSRLDLPFYNTPMEPDPTCPDSSQTGELQKSSVSVVFLVKTTHSHFERRAAIRQTWGSTRCRDALGLVSKVFFLLGGLEGDTVENRKLHQDVTAEYSKHRDLIQFDFVDNYYNNTYKVMSTLWYAARRFNCYKFVTLVDDDFLLHPANLMRVVEKVTSMQYPLYVAGLVYNAILPARNPFTKWYISYNDYRYRVYPRYPSGGTVIIGLPMVRLLAVGMAYTDYLKFDDVHMGMVLMRLGISPVHLPDITIEKRRTDNAIITSHGFNTGKEIVDGWRLIEGTACSQ